MAPLSSLFLGLAVAAIAALSNPSLAAAPSVAVLDVRLLNDNEILEPTTAAERARLVNLEEQVTSIMEASGKYTIKPVPENIKAAIAKGQAIGECGGCDIEYGKEIGAERIVWVTVQKVSNLILNMNFYMADVSENKMLFLKSVDIRGNTDESWSRSMTYLLKNYLLAETAAD